MVGGEIAASMTQINLSFSPLKKDDFFFNLMANFNLCWLKSMQLMVSIARVQKYREVKMYSISSFYDWTVFWLNFNIRKIFS
jgi:hypothetical protein